MVGDAAENAVLATAAAPVQVQPFAADRRDWRYCLAAVGILALMYFVLHNGKWFPGTDTALYISTARSLALGKGYTFNGGPQTKVPPLWPLILAGGMRISTSFAFLNLIPATALLLANVLWYWVLRRLASPFKCFLTVVLSGSLFFVYTAAIQLRTEAAFYLAFAAAILLAQHIAEHRPAWWRIPLLLLAVMAMVLIRWPGVAAWAVVGAALLGGQLWPARNRQWLLLVLSGALALATFAGTYYILTKVLPPKGTRVVYEDTGPRKQKALEEDMDTAAAGGAHTPSIAGGKILSAAVPSILGSGKWIAGLFWMPAYLGVTSKAAGLITNPVGWLIIIMCWLATYQAGRARNWVWVGVICYCGTMIVRCHLPNPRYLVPVAPLLLLAAWVGTELAATWTTGLPSRLFTWCFRLALCSITICNLITWGADLYIARSSDFYGRYYAGESQMLVSAARYVSDRGVQDGQVAVSMFYINLGRQRFNLEGLRSMHMLTGRGTRSSPTTVCTGEPNSRLLVWARRKGVKYYLHRPPVSPWRAWHFKIRWLQERLTGQKNIPDHPGWVLYELDERSAHRVELPHFNNWPTHVPGMDKP